MWIGLKRTNHIEKEISRMNVLMDIDGDNIIFTVFENTGERPFHKIDTVPLKVKSDSFFIDSMLFSIEYNADSLYLNSRELDLLFLKIEDESPKALWDKAGRCYVINGLSYIDTLEFIDENLMLSYQDHKVLQIESFQYKKREFLITTDFFTNSFLVESMTEDSIGLSLYSEKLYRYNLKEISEEIPVRDKLIGKWSWEFPEEIPLPPSWEGRNREDLNTRLEIESDSMHFGYLGRSYSYAYYINKLGDYIYLKDKRGHNLLKVFNIEENQFTMNIPFNLSYIMSDSDRITFSRKQE
jgi:hypothetical protein